MNDVVGRRGRESEISNAVAFDRPCELAVQRRTRTADTIALRRVNLGSPGFALHDMWAIIACRAGRYSIYRPAIWPRPERDIDRGRRRRTFATHHITTRSPHRRRASTSKRLPQFSGRSAARDSRCRRAGNRGAISARDALARLLTSRSRESSGNSRRSGCAGAGGNEAA
jgi:hypothetical protein